MDGIIYIKTQAVSRFIYVSDVNECATKSHGCDVNAVCHNTKGSYKCACKTGYIKNGEKCSSGEYATF